jgi:hypothetical protein
LNVAWGLRGFASQGGVVTQNVNDAPEEGRDTTGGGRAIDPRPKELLGEAGSVSDPSSAVCKGVSPDPDGRYTPFRRPLLGVSSVVSVAQVGAVRRLLAEAGPLPWGPDPTRQRGGSGGAGALVERDRGRRSDRSDPESGRDAGPSGLHREAVAGRSAVVVAGWATRSAVRTLPYASAVVQTPTDEEYSASLGSGGS